MPLSRHRVRRTLSDLGQVVIHTLVTGGPWAVGSAVLGSLGGLVAVLALLELGSLLRASPDLSTVGHPELLRLCALVGASSILPAPLVAVNQIVHDRVSVRSRRIVTESLGRYELSSLGPASRAIKLAQVARGPFGIDIPDGATASLGMFSNIVTAIAICVAMANLGGGAALLIIFGTWLTAESITAARLWTRVSVWQRDLTSQQRLDYVFELGYRQGAREARVFGLHNFLLQSFAAASSGALRQIRRSSASDLIVSVAVVALSMSGAIAGSILVVRAQLGSGNLATVIPALALAIMLLGLQPAYGLVKVGRGVVAVRALRMLSLGGDGQNTGLALERRTSVLPREPRELVFDDVWFTYPGAQSPVLRGVSARFGRGGLSAIVGENGSGKTTMVLLMLGILQPSRGSITIDGISMADLGPTGRLEWQQACAYMGQVPARIPASVGFNLAGLGTDLERWTHSHPRLLDFAVGSVTDSPEPEAAVRLSGGEWQRVGLARLRERVLDGCSTMLMDEPASALDVSTERWLAAELGGWAESTIGILISHRFSIVKGATRIDVLHRGVIAESGTHAELVNLEGVYAGMFRSQVARLGWLEE